MTPAFYAAIHSSIFQRNFRIISLNYSPLSNVGHNR